jgi:DNA-binding transcriptional LysR family regulator
MRARQLEVFRMIMHCGTLTGAAQALNVSQPALSQILQHTEDELGFPLFERRRGRLVPTPEALDLHPDVERLFTDLESLRRHAADLKQGRIGTIRLAASSPPSLSLVPEALRHFRAAHPRVRLQSFVASAEMMIPMILRGEAGLGIAMTDEPVTGLKHETIGQTRIVCVMPEGHELAALEAVTLDDLSAETLISYRASSLPGRRLAQVFAAQEAGFRPDIEIDVSILAIGFVQQGLGLALVDGLLPWSRFPGLVTRPFEPRVELPICLLTSAERPLSRNHDLLRGHLRQACAGICGQPVL